MLGKINKFFRIHIMHIHAIQIKPKFVEWLQKSLKCKRKDIFRFTSLLEELFMAHGDAHFFVLGRNQSRYYFD